MVLKNEGLEHTNIFGVNSKVDFKKDIVQKIQRYKFTEVIQSL